MSYSPPINATVLVVSGATMMTLASVIDPLRAANRLNGASVFQWTLTSVDGRPVELSGGFMFPVSNSFSDRERGNILIVVASFDHQVHASQELVTALRAASRNFDIVCGVEAGTWLLARAGLTIGKSVTTHWEDLENLQQAHPETDVSNARYSIDGRIWTCGGASPAFDMMLNFIERQCTRALALEVASVFVYDQWHPASDKQPTTSLGTYERNEPRLASAIRAMEDTIDSPITTATIARRISISLKTLENLFRRTLLTTPGAYYLKLRLQVARKLVVDTRLGIQEISIRTGFSSQSAFSRAFRNAFGLNPLALRQRGH